MTFSEFKDRFENKKVFEIQSKTPSRPLLSVCIQTYNHSNFIKECLDSILKQQVNFDFEILLGEDNSTDQTRTICLDYAKKFPEKIRLFLHNRENQIPVMGEATSNFNAFYNLFSAKGKYIAFCEGDDFWDDPYKLQKQVEFLESNPSYVFSYHSYREVDEDGKVSNNPESVVQPRSDITADDLKKGEVHPLLLTVCFRNNLKEIPGEILEVINVDSFLLSLLGHFGEAKFLTEISPAGYRKHAGGVWSKRMATLKYLSKIRTYRKLLDYYEALEDNEISLHYKQKLRNTHKMLILFLIKNWKFIEAMKVAHRMMKMGI